jgi:hypothetical protein
MYMFQKQEYLLSQKAKRFSRMTLNFSGCSHTIDGVTT